MLPQSERVARAQDWEQALREPHLWAGSETTRPLMEWTHSSLLHRPWGFNGLINKGWDEERQQGKWQ